jgi:coenzyme Q-binding protein COQ10
MPKHQERRILPYTPEQMFAVVADVEHYPEFVPGCAGIRVRAHDREGRVENLLVDMLVSYSGLRESYQSNVCLDLKSATVTATAIDGPFRELETRWNFAQHPQGCEVHFCVTFAFKNRLLAAVANLAFDKMVRRMADAFVQRAEKLYGKSEHAAQ